MAIVWLEDTVCQQVSLVGGKAANLAKLAGHFCVPPGFVVHHASVSPTVVRAAYRQLGDVIGEPNPAVAVRSSAIDEDSAGASFAGQHETYLNISGADEVYAAIERCWQSAFSERALAYRRQQGIPMQGTQLAVLIQVLVPADVAAVVFSANPLNQRRHQVVVTASWGLGESIVGGTVTPDTFIIESDPTLRRPQQIITRQVADKAKMTIRHANGTREVDVPRLLRTRPAVTDEAVLEMAQLALDLQAKFGHPVDVECAYAGDKLYLLQCRPITTLTAQQTTVTLPAFPP